MRHGLVSAALVAIATLGLAACSSEKAEEPAVEAASATPSPATAENPAPIASPAPMQTPAATAIPQAIQGRWGLVPADCTSTRGDAKGLLVIDATALTFYESVAKLTEVKEASDTRLRGGFSFTGEGMSWTRDLRLDAQDGGKTLIRREYGEDAAPAPFTYTRC